MAQDLREMFAKERKEQMHSMEKGHEERFVAKLEEKMPMVDSKTKRTPAVFLQIAASVVVILGLGIYFFTSAGNGKPSPDTEIVNTENTDVKEQTISLGDLSPDLKKIENYYLTNINLELSDLEFDTNNKEIIDNYMEQLAELDKEYRRLNKELNDFGPNDQTVNALIKNLQLRLQLLQKLKSKLNQLKSSKNEQKPSNIV
ncbi:MULTISPECIES: hypothetical protein [Flavobacteriaceae]|uniref:hypothetical protein n=1 Tax=Flavobacteriaceae TaxID=49546 RepID=UPI0014925EDD|nr:MULTISPECIES: hypothetical protein [Allomuricauda]MDC6367471.1 hypothetical protein [Muricauda sp. AC10]